MTLVLSHDKPAQGELYDILKSGGKPLTYEELVRKLRGSYTPGSISRALGSLVSDGKIFEKRGPVIEKEVTRKVPHYKQPVFYIDPNTPEEDLPVVYTPMW